MALKIGVEPSVDRMTITPELAFQMLTEYNTHNRPVTRRRVNDYAHAMRSGNWLYNPADAITFDTAGVLQNGQHRLEAVVDSGIAQEFLVVTGVAVETQDVMDVGLKRTIAHQLALNGIDNAKELATIGRSYLKWKSGTIVSLKNAPTTVDVRRWVDESSNDSLDFAIKRGKEVSKMTPLLIGPVGAGAYGAFMRDPAAADQFFTDLVEGVGLDKGHPALTLMKYLQRQGQIGTKFLPTHQLWLIVSTWNTWRQGKTLGKIMSPSEFTSENFPKMR